MPQIDTIIIDDEPKLRKVLQLKLQQFCPETCVVAEAGNINDAYLKILEKKPKLIFLDIAMPGGNGFELLDKFNEIPFEIIFVTGYSDYVLSALKASAVDYLLKPLDTQELIQAVQKAQLRIYERTKLHLYENLKHNIHHIGDQQTRITIPGMDAYDFVAIKDIVRCEGWQKYTRIYLLNGSCIISSYNLGVFREMLSEYGFYSTHKSHFINTHLILRYLKEGTVIMIDESKVPVSRRKRDEFSEKVLKSFAP